MSIYSSERLQDFKSYVPGEQPRDRHYIKLNTNESPFPPSPAVIAAAEQEAANCNLYPDPTSYELRRAAAEVFGVPTECILPVNGSDEILNFAFMAFCDMRHPVAFPDITYGVYPILAKLHGIPFREVPVREDFSVNYQDYLGLSHTIVLANPNAPTGLVLSAEEIEAIVSSNKNNVVIVDEAYVSFGGRSVIPLTEKYDNLLVTRTFSKSHSMAGARLGFGIGSQKLIEDMNLVKYATNAYNVNRMTAAMGTAALRENESAVRNCSVIAEVRDRTAHRLRELGFWLTDSKANFLFARTDQIDGIALYEALRARGILVRHFSKPAISGFNRITVGTAEQMEKFLAATAAILNQREVTK